MADPLQLAREAVSLDDTQWLVFVEHLGQAWEERNRDLTSEPPQGASRDEVAAWIAKHHLATDPGITEVWYLPSGAPQDEIRLLDVNVLLPALNDDPVSAVDFGFDVEGLHFRLLVADVTPLQWQRLQRGELALPETWMLDGARRFRLTSP